MVAGDSVNMDTTRFSGDYLSRLAALLPQLDTAAIDAAIAAMATARDTGRTVYACGNGGSGLIASEMVSDIVKGGSPGPTRRFRMLGLNDSSATVTAYANDVGYDDVFVEQLKNWAAAGDVLIAISGSGNSGNVLKAVRYANDVGCTTIGLTSADSGDLRDLVTLPLLVPGTHMGRLEDCFFVITHIICYAFMEGSA
jgi:D-sedoheptulose 7-phosphate isomerase